jgi:hypothetical protein
MQRRTTSGYKVHVTLKLPGKLQCVQRSSVHLCVASAHYSCMHPLKVSKMTPKQQWYLNTIFTWMEDGFTNFCTENVILYIYLMLLQANMKDSKYLKICYMSSQLPSNILCLDHSQFHHLHCNSLLFTITASHLQQSLFCGQTTHSSQYLTLKHISV